MLLIDKTLNKIPVEWREQKWFNSIRVLVIGIVLISAAFVAPRVATRDSQKLTLGFILFLLLTGFEVVLRWPVLGLIITMLGGMFVSFVGPAGLNMAVVGVGLLLIQWLLDMLLKQRTIRFVPSRTILPLLIFMLISLFSFGFGQLPWYTFAQHAPMDAQLGGLAIALLSGGAFLLVAHQVRDLHWLQVMTWVFIGLGVIYPLGRLIGWEGVDRIYHYGFSAGSLYWTWLVALTFGQLVYNNRLHRFWRFVLLCLLLITLYNAVVQGYDWKSGWLPPLVAIGVILAARSGRLILILSLAALVPLFFVIKDLIGTDLYSWGTRLDAWVIVLGIAKVNPFLGLGFANYYWYTPLFPIRGFAVVFNSHSQYVDLIAQVGLLGLAVYFWFFAEAGRLGWQLRTRAPAGFARAYVFGALGGLAGTVVAGFLVDWVIPFVYNIGMTGFRASVLFWLFLGGLVSVEQIVRRDALKAKAAN
jgi:hypothetical protein